MSVFVIVNRNAGSGKVARKWPEIQARLSASIGQFDYAFTNGPGDATRLSREAIITGARLVVAVGGDGTVNETANGFANSTGTVSTKAAMAVIPCGTGSDFGKTFGLDKNLQRAVDRIAAGEEQRIDVGQIKYNLADGQPATRLFLNIASFGLSGLICHNINRTAATSLLPGKLHYLAKTLGSLFSYRPPRVRLFIDEHAIEEEIIFVAIANGRYFGGGMMVAPHADPCDGQLEVVVLQATGKMRLARNISTIYKGAHIGLPEITALRGSKIRAQVISSGNGENVMFETDGESPGTLNCDISVQTAALRLVT